MPDKKERKDTVFKKIFGDKELFLMFLKDFINKSWVKDISVEDLKLLPSKYIGLRESTRESDIVYEINHNELKMYVFVLLEHQGKVNFLMVFRMLEYMTRIWRSRIKEIGKKPSERKEYKLPPIVPIVFYDGIENWTAETEFQKKIEKYELFKNNIPKFEYELINLNKISIEKLEKLEDAMSFILIIDKCREPKDFEKMKDLKEEFWEKIKEALKNENILETVAESIEKMMERLNVPEKEIDNMVNMLEEGRVSEMFNFTANYDVQKVRAEGIAEGIKTGIEKGIEKVALNMLENGMSIEIVENITGLSREKIEEILKEVNHN